MLRVVWAQAKKRSHRSGRIGSDRLVLRVSEKLRDPLRAYRVNASEVSFQNYKSLIRQR